MATPDPPIAAATPRPLLVFQPAEVRDWTGSRSGRERLHTPPPATQSGRHGPRLRELVAALASERAALQASVPTAEPEHVIVFEVAGSVERFVKAVSKVDGMEFLADVDEDDFPPDEDYYLSDRDGRTEKSVGRSLYLVLTNARAAEELLSLWDRWTRNPDESFARGLAPWRHVFAQLLALRRWSAIDRVAETGLLEEWEFRLAQGLQTVEAELDLWFRASADARRVAEGHVRALIEGVGGHVIASAVVPEIAYHALAVSLPAVGLQEVRSAGADSIELLRAEEIMFASPASQVLAETSTETTDGDGWPAVQPTGEPVVALLDGLPLSGHQALVGRLRIDDPDDLEPAYPAARRRHGTAMASIICHGDLSRPSGPIRSPVYVRPVLVPDESDPKQARERFPSGSLPVDVIHRAIRRMLVGDGNQPAAAPTVRVVNLSLGDAARPFVRHMSPWARLLDWLAYEHNVLVVVSAGNHGGDIELPMSEADFRKLGAVDREQAVLRAMQKRGLLQRLLSPAEALNVLTVGAAHSDDASDGPATANRVVLASNPRLPAPYSPIGAGFRRAVKPEVLAPGGRRAYGAPVEAGPPVRLRSLESVIYPPGMLVAQPSVEGGLGAQQYSAGTSNAAALVAHYAGRLHESLTALRSAIGPNQQLEDAYLPVVLKALLVHGSSWDSGLDVIANTFTVEGQEARQRAARLLGYGFVQLDRCSHGLPTRALVVGSGGLLDRREARFRFPLPPSLASRVEWRRLTVTLAWMTPIAQRSRRLRAARLWFEPPTDPLLVTRRQVDWLAARRGTVQHEILEGDQAAVFVDGDDLVIPVACRIDEGKVEQPVRFGLVASLEVGDGVRIPVHDEVRDRLQVTVRPRT